MASSKTEEEKAHRANLDRTYVRLKEIRKSTTLSLKACRFLRAEILVDGSPVPLKIRYYQSIGIFHLLSMKRLLLGDGTGLGKTLQLLGALAYTWDKEHDNKVIVVTPKSALWQWAGEVEKFTTGIRALVVTGSFEERLRVYKDFVSAPTGPDAEKVILLLNYAILQRDWDAGGFQPLKPDGKPDPKAPVVPGILDDLTSKIPRLTVAFDEATAFKNVKTKTWQVCQRLSLRSARCYGLTATLLKNNLMEGFSIFKVIQPTLFSTKSKFLDMFCHVKLHDVPGGRKIPVVIGYKNLAVFRQMIDPYFLGRPKHEVSTELPKLVTKEVVCELSKVEEVKYSEALSGILRLGDGEVKDYSEAKAMASLIYCQEIVDSLTLLKYREGDEIGEFEMDDDPHMVSATSSKEAALLELLTGELEDEKVIIYTRFEKFVTRLVEVLKSAKIKSFRITGKEKDKAREAAKLAFQDPKQTDVRVIFITDAGSESINLHAASGLIFMDAPWSYGNYLQILGRPVRIGSVHDVVVVYHLVAVRSGKTEKQRKTIDRHVLEQLRSKKSLADAVLGETALGALDFEKDRSASKDLIRRLRDVD